jgi:hypothetical protein
LTRSTIGRHAAAPGGERGVQAPPVDTALQPVRHHIDDVVLDDGVGEVEVDEIQVALEAQWELALPPQHRPSSDRAGGQRALHDGVVAADVVEHPVRQIRIPRS